MDLYDYLHENATRVPSEDGEADVIFFGVNKGPQASAEGLREAIAAHKSEYCQCDPFDGEEHSYIELGAWLGDQGLALTLIGLGAILELWRLLTPRTILGDDIEPQQAMQMAGQGYVALITPK